MEGCWANLPEELLGSIFRYVFTTKDRRTFKLVCRSWNSAANASPHYPHLPCFVSRERNRPSWKFYQYNDSFYADLSEYAHAKLRCSNFGWLLMEREDRTFFFYDPFNNCRIEVPTPRAYQRNYFYFGNTVYFFHQPTSPDCFLLGVIQYKECVWIGILRHGSGEWDGHKYHLEKPGKKFWMSECTPVLRNGLLYFLSVKGDVATFDVEKHKHSSAWTVYTECLWPQTFQDTIQGSFLLRIEDDNDAFFAVFDMYDAGEARVYKLLEPEMEWELVNDLGDMALYVSCFSAFGVRAPVKSIGNTIYFAHMKDDNPVFYSLKDRKYRSFDGGNYSCNYSYPYQRMDFVAWIIPSPRRIDMVLSEWM